MAPRSMSHLLSPLAIAALTACSSDPEQAPPATCDPPKPEMTFFVTEHGTGSAGGNLGGLAGADARCQQAAEAAGITGKTWRAYLSAENDATFGRVDARDRIGAGPWMAHDGSSIGDLAAIHFEGSGAGVPLASIKTECGRSIKSGDTVSGDQARHDVLTGSDGAGRLMRAIDPGTGLPTGAALTCDDWRSSAASPHKAWVGHTDGGQDQSWNSAHDTLGCTPAQFVEYDGSGALYCFVSN